MPSINENGRVKHFYCGSQGADWVCNNCDECAKGYDYDAGDYRNCDLLEAIDDAYCIGDGTLSEDHARRIGALSDEGGNYCWRCPEFQDPETDPYIPPSVIMPGQGELFDYVEEVAIDKHMKLDAERLVTA